MFQKQTNFSIQTNGSDSSESIQQQKKTKGNEMKWMKTIIMKWEKKKKILNEKLDAFFSVASITIIIIIMIIIFNNCYILFVGSTILTAKMKYKKTGHPSINSFFLTFFPDIWIVCVCVFVNFTITNIKKNLSVWIIC